MKKPLRTVGVSTQIQPKHLLNTDLASLS